MPAEPRPPKVRAKTAREKAEDQEQQTRRQERERRRILGTRLHDLINQRSNDITTASPYDLVADALMSTFTDQLFAAINSPDFADNLAERGYVVAPTISPNNVPAASDEWLHDATDLIGAEGDWSEPFERIDDLWRRAYTAGWSAGRQENTPRDQHPTPDAYTAAVHALEKHRARAAIHANTILTINNLLNIGWGNEDGLRKRITDTIKQGAEQIRDLSPAPASYTEGDWTDRGCDGCGKTVAAATRTGIVLCPTCHPADLPLQPPAVPNGDL